jgi:hypothetical protein
MTMCSERIFLGPLVQLFFRYVVMLDSPGFFGTDGTLDYDSAHGQSWRAVPLGA